MAAIVKNKAVVKLGLDDAKSKKAAMKALVGMEGFSSYTLDCEKSTLVVMGDMDPIVLVYKLRKFVSAQLVTYGPEKDEGKSQKDVVGGGKVDQKQKNDGGGGGKVDLKQKNNGGGGNVHQKQQQQQQPVNRPFNYGIGTSGYGYTNDPFYPQP